MFTLQRKGFEASLKTASEAISDSSLNLFALSRQFDYQTLQALLGFSQLSPGFFVGASLYLFYYFLSFFLVCSSLLLRPEESSYCCTNSG